VDFPISVPSIGLVDGKFVDEDPLGGTPGSLIPSAWGNAVTEELLAVIQDAGFAPDENNNAQLLAAIKAIISTGVPAATELMAGRAKVATQTQITIGTDDATMVSPKKLAVRLAAGGPMLSIPASLKMTVAAASATATITADEVVVKSGLAGRTWTIGGFNKPINLGNVGAGGIDAAPAAANSWLAIYAGLNESSGVTTVFAQNVANNVAPAIYGGANIPLGITATALLAVVPTGAGGQFKPCAVRGRDVFIPLIAAYSGNASVPNNPISIAALVPANAIAITHGELQIQNTIQSAMSLTVGPDASYFGQQNIGTTIYGPGILTSNYSKIPLIIPQQIMFSSSSSAGIATYNIYLSGYSI